MKRRLQWLMVMHCVGTKLLSNRLRRHYEMNVAGIGLPFKELAFGELLAFHPFNSVNRNNNRFFIRRISIRLINHNKVKHKKYKYQLMKRKARNVCRACRLMSLWFLIHRMVPTTPEHNTNHTIFLSCSRQFYTIFAHLFS